MSNGQGDSMRDMNRDLDIMISGLNMRIDLNMIKDLDMIKELKDSARVEDNMFLDQGDSMRDHNMHLGMIRDLLMIMVVADKDMIILRIHNYI